MNASSPNRSANASGNRFKVNTLWFRNAIRDRRTTANAIADLLGWQRSEFSRKLNGKRAFTYEDCEALAHQLKAPLHDVLTAANVHLPPPAPLPVLGRVDLDGAFTLTSGDHKPKVKDRGDVEIPQPGMALPLRVPFLVAPTAPDNALKESMPGIAVTADGRALLRIVRSGSKPGRFDLLPAFGLGERENDVELLRVHWVAPAMLG